jgi:hypothetical protein
VLECALLLTLIPLISPLGWDYTFVTSIKNVSRWRPSLAARVFLSSKKYNRCVADTEAFTTRVLDGDFIVTERDTSWLVRRAVGDRASQTTWVFKDGEAAAVAQALIFARHDRTAAWMRVDHHQFRLIQSFRP